MSGPRRHGARTARAVAACTLVFLALGAVFLRAGAASAHPVRQHHASHHQATQAGLLGGLLGGVGRTLDDTVKGVTGLLHPQATTTAPTTPTGAPTSAPTSAPPTSGTPAPTRPRPTPTAPAASAPARPAPTHSRPTSPTPTRPPTTQAVHVAPVAATHGTSTSQRHAARPARPVVQPVSAFDNDPIGVPELDLMTSLAGLLVAMVLGVGLLVYRAGYRGERTRR